MYCKRIAFLSTSAAGVRSVSAMPPAAQVLIKATSLTTSENHLKDCFQFNILIYSIVFSVLCFCFDFVFSFSLE